MPKHTHLVKYEQLFVNYSFPCFSKMEFRTRATIFAPRNQHQSESIYAANRHQTAPP